MKEEFIQFAPLFVGLSEDEQKIIGDGFAAGSIGAATTLFEAGDTAEALYLIGQGFVRDKQIARRLDVSRRDVAGDKFGWRQSAFRHDDKSEQGNQHQQQKDPLEPFVALTQLRLTLPGHLLLARAVFCLSLVFRHIYPVSGELLTGLFCIVGADDPLNNRVSDHVHVGEGNKADAIHMA